MENAKLILMKEEIEELVVSEIKNKTNLILSKGDFKLNLKTGHDEISGDVFLFDEYYGNFRIPIPKEAIQEKICEIIFLVFSEFGDLEALVISGKNHNLQNKLNGTTTKILHLIKSKTEASERLGEITIMVDEKYPFGEFYESHFPVLVYRISDTTQKLSIAVRLDYELDDFDELYILNLVEKEIDKILNE